MTPLTAVFWLLLLPESDMLLMFCLAQGLHTRLVKLLGVLHGISILTLSHAKQSTVVACSSTWRAAILFASSMLSSKTQSVSNWLLSWTTKEKRKKPCELILTDNGYHFTYLGCTSHPATDHRACRGMEGQSTFFSGPALAKHVINNLHKWTEEWDCWTLFGSNN